MKSGKRFARSGPDYTSSHLANLPHHGTNPDYQSASFATAEPVKRLFVQMRTTFSEIRLFNDNLSWMAHLLYSMEKSGV